MTINNEFITRVIGNVSLRVNEILTQNDFDCSELCRSLKKGIEEAIKLI